MLASGTGNLATMDIGQRSGCSVLYRFMVSFLPATGDGKPVKMWFPVTGVESETLFVARDAAEPGQALVYHRRPTPYCGKTC